MSIRTLLSILCLFAPPVNASRVLEDPNYEVEMVNHGSPNSMLRHHNNFRCSVENNERVCRIGASLDSNRLDMTTYCPLDSAWLADCTCSVSYRGNECTSCSYCRDTQVFVVDCANVITNRRCAAVNCNGVCLKWGSGTTAGPYHTSDASVKMSKESAAAIAVFATMCCLPCITALLCAKFLPRSRSYSVGEGGGATSRLGSPFARTEEDRSAAIEACLKTKKVDEEDLGETNQDAVEQAPPKAIIDTQSTLTETSEASESNTDNEKVASGDSLSIASESEQSSKLNSSSTAPSSKEPVALNTSTTGQEETDTEDETATDVYSNIDDDDDRELCQICLEPFRTGDERSWSQVSKCRHSFHKDCITEWLQRHDDCPCCRATFLTFDAIESNEAGGEEAVEADP